MISNSIPVTSLFFLILRVCPNRYANSVRVRVLKKQRSNPVVLFYYITIVENIEE